MNSLARHYQKFRVTERTLLTGHSHQAWPDCAFEAHMQAWLDAADLVDAKWQKAFEKAEAVRAGFARLLGDPDGLYALAPSTHDLVIRFLSALPLKERPRLVTTDSEFHSLRRQLQRLEEEGIEVDWVPAHPVESLPQRMIDAIDERTAAALMSMVFFNSGQIAPDLKSINSRCEAVGARFLIDVYHALNVVPFEMAGLESAFIVGGGYKYCQLGEGNCFLRFPKDCVLRPVLTGWMADFEALERPVILGHRVNYSDGGARFAGSTYDPTSHYRGAAVFEFFAREGLSPHRLRAINQAQLRILCHEFDQLDLPPQVISRDRSIPLDRIGGFLALKTPYALRITQALKHQGVYTDYRGDVLRLGPAPYLSDDQLRSAISALGTLCKTKFYK